MFGIDWQILLQVIINGLFMGGLYTLMSVGLTLIAGVMDMVNFAHGELLMLGMYASFFLFSLFGIDPLISIGICTLILFVVGVLVEQLVIRPILNAPRTNQFVATMGLKIVLTNLALLLWGSTFRAIKTSYSDYRIVLSDKIAFLTIRPVAFAFSVGITVSLYFFLSKTYTGKGLRATATDREAASLMGVNVHRMYMLAWGLGAACVGAAGALLSTFFVAFPTVGLYFGTTAFVVIVLGGLGNFIGAFAGGLIIGVVEALGGFLISPDVPEVVVFVIFMLALLLKPQGLFGKRRQG